ncbi:MAG: hypothetical protein N2253_00845 [Bacteroidia bacterium]|nr:hypothetical protein [Bacteroidia bacterium]MCX7763424.1 hypothetical protein [Bacteroidia bacterium]MDW8057589.1 hypothetical protein [Bacteroidia bacterium]
MIVRLSLLATLLWAQTGGYDPNEVIGEDSETVSQPYVPKREEILIQVNGEPFTWQDPLVIQGGKTYNIHITGLKPGSKFILRLFKAGQKAGATHFDANEVGEIELEATLNKQKFQGTAEVIYYPSNGREVRRRFTVKVQ